MSGGAAAGAAAAAVLTGLRLLLFPFCWLMATLQANDAGRSAQLLPPRCHTGSHARSKPWSTELEAGRACLGRRIPLVVADRLLRMLTRRGRRSILGWPSLDGTQVALLILLHLRLWSDWQETSKAASAALPVAGTAFPRN